MKVLAIRGRNLASLAGDFEVDFESEPLASAGIFAITGPTGAGKSTLLDAVCLALFGQLPRLANATGGQVGVEGGEAMSAKDPRAVLRHNTGEGFAEVDFVGRDRVRHRARWAVRRARGRAAGALQNASQELTNLDTGDRIGGTRSETLEAIRECIGLTADQFARAVMLAQGDFDAFVRANANERAALLEKLTGTGIYARLGMAAKRKADRLQDELNLIEKRIVDQRVLDDVARTTAEKKLAEAQAALTAAVEALARLERDRLWHETAATLATRVAEAQVALDAAQEAHAAAAPRREALQQRIRASTCVAEWRAAEHAKERAARAAGQVTELENALAEAEAEAERCAATEAQATDALRAAETALTEARPVLEQARTLDRNLETVATELATVEAIRIAKAKEQQQAETAWQQAQSQHRDSQAHCTALAQWLTAHEGRRGLALREEPLRADLAEYAVLADRRDRLAEQTQTVADDVTQVTKARMEADETVSSAQIAQTSAQKMLERAQADAPSAEAVEAAMRARDALAAVEPKLASVEHYGTRIIELEADAVRIEAERSCEVGALARHSEQAAKIDAALPALRGRLEEARRSSALSSAAVEDAAAHLREALVPGEPCPVCGSRDHAADAVAVLIEERAAADRGRLAALDDEVRGHERDAAVFAERIRTAQRRIADLQDNAQRIATALGTAQGEQRAALATLSAAAATVDLPIDSNPAVLRAAISERLKAADANRAALEAARQAYEQARAETEQRRKNLEATEVKRADAVEAERAALSQQADIARRLDDVVDRQERLGVALHRELAPHFDWAQAHDAQAELARLVVDWREREHAHHQAVAALPGLTEALHAADIARTMKKTELDQAEQSATGLRSRRKQLADMRAELFSGEATASVARRLEGAVRAGVDACEAARAVHGDARTAVVGAEARLKGGKDTQQADEADAAQRSAELAGRLAALGLTIDAVAMEAVAGEAALEAEQEALRLIDDAVTRTSAERDARHGDHAAHLATAAPDLAPDALAIAIAAAKTDHVQAREVEGEAALVIRQDNAARAATEVLRTELASKQAAAQVWLQLNDLIGDATGNKFRRFAQGLTLDRLVLHANAHLADLRPRYELQRGAGGDMLLQVVDHDMAGEVRGLHNLSGGERFLVSLALALGLSEMSTGQGLRIESLFIDEGFGALDSASLGSAIAVLEQLHATGRHVGVISHIEEVKERISVKIAVTPVARGRSTVEVLAE